VSQRADKPNPVFRLRRFGLRRDDDHSSRPVIAHRLQRPTRWPRTGRPSGRVAAPAATLFGLAPCGVLPATNVTVGAVRSYRTFSPLLPCIRCTWGELPRGSRCARLLPRSTECTAAVYFLCHFPSGCPARTLSGALPCGVRTFLPRQRATPAIVWLTATLHYHLLMQEPPLFSHRLPA